MNMITAGLFLHLSGTIMAAEDISAVAKIDSFLVIGSDEGFGKAGNKNYIQLLKEEKNGSYRVRNDILLLEGNDADGNELDIEGIAVEGRHIYVIGSHSAKRKKIKQSRTYHKNRKKFQDSKIEEEKNRDWLYQVRIDADGHAVEKRKITLRKIIQNDPVLKTFSRIPSKENGVDIEGIAAQDGWLYIGFRGPVFRENYVPLMKLKFADPEDSYELLYVQLDGRGIRDMASVSDGFLILAGPVGDGTDSYQLYHWDGKDVIAGKDRNPDEMGKLHLLGEIKPPQEGKVEGLAVLQEEPTLYRVIIAYDGVNDTDKILQHFQVYK